MYPTAGLSHFGAGTVRSRTNSAGSLAGEVVRILRSERGTQAADETPNLAPERSSEIIRSQISPWSKNPISRVIYHVNDGERENGAVTTNRQSAVDGACSYRKVTRAQQSLLSEKGRQAHEGESIYAQIRSILLKGDLAIEVRYQPW